MVRDTPSHGSDHLCLIWKESIHNCRWYRADTACGTDGWTDGQTDGRTDRRTDGRSETSIPPQQLRCAGGIITHHDLESLHMLSIHQFRLFGLQLHKFESLFLNSARSTFLALITCGCVLPVQTNIIEAQTVFTPRSLVIYGIFH